MKKIFRYMTFALSLCTLFSVTSCSWQDKINQLRCEHDFTAGDVIKEATCLEPGTMSRTCDLCGVEDVVEIPAKGHVAVNAGVNVEPTCTRSGYDFGKVCQDCGVVLEKDKLIAPIDHKPVVITMEGTCSTVGVKDQVVCEDCDQVLLQGEELPLNPDNHTDINGDGRCDECSIVTVFSNLVQGEKYKDGVPIADKILRFYFNDDGGYVKFFDEFYLYFYRYWFDCSPTPFEYQASYAYADEVPLYDVHVDYVDVYFAAKTYILKDHFDGDDLSWTIDDSTVFEYFPDDAEVYIMEKA